LYLCSLFNIQGPEPIHFAVGVIDPPPGPAISE
jgi:hypothetical protein